MVVCEHLRGVTGAREACVFLRHHEGWYSCRAHGFRLTEPGVGGAALREEGRVRYDRKMLLSEKRLRTNFCHFRFVGILVWLWGRITHFLHWLLGHPLDAD